MTVVRLRLLALTVLSFAVLAGCSASHPTGETSDDQERVELYRADFAGESLERADLQGAILRRAQFTYANLTRANLSGATLIAADFRNAILIDANLNGADLRHADFTGADIRGATFDGARWDDTICPDGESSRMYLGTCPVEFFGGVRQSGERAD